MHYSGKDDNEDRPRFPILSVHIPIYHHRQLGERQLPAELRRNFLDRSELAGVERRFVQSCSLRLSFRRLRVREIIIPMVNAQPPHNWAPLFEPICLVSTNTATA